MIPNTPLNLLLKDSISTLIKIPTEGMNSPCKLGFQYFPNATPISAFVSTTNVCPEISDCEGKIIMAKPLNMIIPSKTG